MTDDADLTSRFGEAAVDECVESHATLDTPSAPKAVQRKATKVAREQIWNPIVNVRGILGTGKAYEPEQIARLTGLLPAQIGAALCELEMQGVVVRDGAAWADGVQVTVRIIVGESVHCCVTSPLLADLIQRFRAQVNHFHCVAYRLRANGAANMPTPFCNTDLRARGFKRAQRQGILCLHAFYTQKWQQRFEARACLCVGDGPRKQRSSVFCGWLRHVDRSTESGRKGRRYLRRYLAQCRAFGVHRLSGITALAHRISAFLDADCAIRINRSSEVRKFGLFHSMTIPQLRG